MIKGVVHTLKKIIASCAEEFVILLKHIRFKDSSCTKWQNNTWNGHLYLIIAWVHTSFN